jgi:hypothetical protein
MNEIINYNCHKECADICMETYCDNLATHYWKVKIGEYCFLIPMCEKHFGKSLNFKEIKNE